MFGVVFEGGGVLLLVWCSERGSVCGYHHYIITAIHNTTVLTLTSEVISVMSMSSPNFFSMSSTGLTRHITLMFPCISRSLLWIPLRSLFSYNITNSNIISNKKSEKSKKKLKKYSGITKEIEI